MSSNNYNKEKTIQRLLYELHMCQLNGLTKFDVEQEIRIKNKYLNEDGTAYEYVNEQMIINKNYYQIEPQPAVQPPIENDGDVEPLVQQNGVPPNNIADVVEPPAGVVTAIINGLRRLLRLD